MLVVVLGACTNQKKEAAGVDKQFASFEDKFLDAYWKQHPSAAVFAGYGKYYDLLIIPDNNAVASDIAFSNAWIDSLNKMDFNALSDNNKISHRIIMNQLESDKWYEETFKIQEWNASIYNLSGECDYITNQSYAPLDTRLRFLSKHLENADQYYAAGLHMLHTPTKEHLQLAIRQNMGGLAVFGDALNDSIKASGLNADEKATLEKNIAKTKTAMTAFADSLKVIVDDKNRTFKNFRIGKELFAQKFKYDLVTDLTPEETYKKAMDDKAMYLQKMVKIAGDLWPKYYSNQSRPKDDLQAVQMVIDKIQLQHAAPKDFFDTLTNQVHRLKRFIIEKDLFDFDTLNPPIKVRLMPEYARGVAIANAEFTPPYQKQGTTWYNIDDLTQYPPEKAEGSLKEYNNYGCQFLSIHEAVPGHCVQGIYNNKKSPDIVRAVFQNGAMIEGWAVYTESMMFENGWGGKVPELEMVLYKLKLRELANVLIDYQIQCLDYPKDSIIHLLNVECFQTQAQAEEKYNRATLSQVQLCSYFTGATAIRDLREEYKKKMGDKYSLKNFHETFLSFGSSPVKYIRERMLENSKPQL